MAANIDDDDNETTTKFDGQTLSWRASEERGRTRAHDGWMEGAGRMRERTRAFCGGGGGGGGRRAIRFAFVASAANAAASADAT